MKNTDANVKRTYSVWRMHGDGIKELATSYDKESNTLTFETDRFSTYVIAYSDTTINSGNTGNDSGNTNATVTPAPTTSSDVDSVPKTGDTNELIVWFAFMVVAGIGAAIYGFKNRKETSEE